MQATICKALVLKGHIMVFRQLSTILFSIITLLFTGLAAADSNSNEKPAAIKQLEAQGLRHVHEFDAPEGVRAFAGLGGDQPVAIYVLPDGSAVVGTRLNSQAQPVDEAALHELVAKPISQEQWAKLEAATWVQDGKSEAPRVIYTFTDANCPYCHLFWEAARPWVHSGKVQLRHLMVGVIRPDSAGKAAAILAADNPSEALLENENAFDGGGITPLATIPTEVATALEENRDLMMSMGFRGTPGIVVLDSEGLVQKHNGMPQAEDLDDIFKQP